MQSSRAKSRDPVARREKFRRGSSTPLRLGQNDGEECRLLQVVNFDQANPGGVVQSAHDGGVGAGRESRENG